MCHRQTCTYVFKPEIQGLALELTVCLFAATAAASVSATATFCPPPLPTPQKRTCVVSYPPPPPSDWIDGLETFIQQIQHKGWLGGWLLPQVSQSLRVLC